MLDQQDAASSTQEPGNTTTTTKGLPPGPRLPAAIQMGEWILRPIAFLERNSHRYGDFFTVRFLFGNVVFVANPDIIKEVFKGDPDTFHAGEGNATPLEPVVGRHSVLLLDGPEHMRHRKLMLPSFHGERMQRYGPLMAEITEREVERWPVGQPFGLRPRTQAITLEIIMRTVFGIEDAERLEQLRDRLGRLLDIGMHRSALAGIAVPALRQTVGRRIWARFQRLRAEVDEVLFDEIARRRAAPDAADGDDVLSILLLARDDDGKPMTDQELRDELMTLLVAGHETTATTLAWAFYLLLRHPKELERLQAEVDAGESDDYLDAVIKETLRIRPVVPGVIRKLTRPIELNGYELPAGTRVAPNIYLTHRRPDVYPEPERFRPERFLETPAETYSWIPFGGGIRRCLGASFATYELKIVIPTILKLVRLRATGEGPEPIRRRAITFVPERDTRVIVEAFRERPAAAPDQAPVAA
jgi:cytochrome P450